MTARRVAKNANLIIVVVGKLVLLVFGKVDCRMTKAKTYVCSFELYFGVLKAKHVLLEQTAVEFAILVSSLMVTAAVLFLRMICISN